MITDDYAEYLLEEANTDIVAIHQFMVLYREDDGAIHLFFEGDEDGLFYVPEIRRRADSRILHHYECGGKRNVICVRNFIRQNDYRAVCLYFIDRDFDDLLERQVVDLDRVYMTDWYSIETDLCSDIAVEIVVQDLLRLSRVDRDYGEIVALIKRSMAEFCLVTCSLAAWIIAAREIGIAVNLRNTNGLQRIISVVANGRPVFAGKGFGTFVTRTVTGGERPPFGRVKYWCRRLKAMDARCWVRGKYLYWFFFTSLARIISDVNVDRRSRGEKIVRMPSSLREGRLFECLGGRVPPPESLTRYLIAQL